MRDEKRRRGVDGTDVRTMLGRCDGNDCHLIDVTVCPICLAMLRACTRLRYDRSCHLLGCEDVMMHLGFIEKV